MKMKKKIISLAAAMVVLVGGNAAYADNPVITAPTLTIAENSASTFLFSSSIDPVTWSLEPDSGGDSIDVTFLQLTAITTTSVRVGFISPPDFEFANDNGGNNTYKFKLKATTNHSHLKTESYQITVTNVVNEPPVITGSATPSIAENVSTSTVIENYNANETVTWGLEGTDAASFTISNIIGVNNGELKFVTSPNFESQPSYAVIITATDTDSNKTSLPVTVSITDVDELAPVITGSATPSIAENVSTSTVIENYNANETVTWGLEGTDAASFTISNIIGVNNGELKFVTSPNFESQPSYAVIITATDTDSNKTSLPVTVSITDVDELAPVILCDEIDCGGLVTKDVPENATGAVIYSFSANEPVTWSLENCTEETCASGDKNYFSIDSSGDLTIVAREFDPTPGGGEGNDNSYTVVVVATDTTGNASTLEFNVNVTEVDEVAPIIIGAETISVDENQDPSTILETYSASEAVTWLVEGADSASFSISSSGELRLVTAADYETKSSYSIEIIATDAASNSTSYPVLIQIVDVTEAGGGDDDEEEPSEDTQQINETRLIKAVNEMHSNMKRALESAISLTGVRSMENPASLIYLAVPGLTPQNVLQIHQLFAASNSGDSVESFIAYARKYAIVSRLATAGLTMGVTLKELQILGLVKAGASADTSLLRALRAVPLSDRDTVEELEKVIASILASR